MVRGKNKVGKFSIDVWEDLYSQGKSILLYPDSTFVSLSHHLLKKDKHPKVLDYSFGSGSNMISMLKRGFDVSGVEVSPSAIDIVHQRLKKERLSAELKLFKGIQLPYQDNTFDALIAWQVLDYKTWESLALAVKEIDRVLKVGGMFIGTFSMAAPSHKKLSNSLYQLKVSSQKGLARMAVEKKDLRKCFPFGKISIGKSGFEYNSTQYWYWIITYEKD